MLSKSGAVGNACERNILRRRKEEETDDGKLHLRISFEQLIGEARGFWTWEDGDRSWWAI